LSALHGAAAECLCGGGDRVGGGLYADVELGKHIDPHPVAGNERLLVGPPHFKSQRIHIDRDRFVQHREYDSATIHHHFLAAEAGTDERDLFRGAAVKP
jgi:hypothetical protein